jgi:tyrosine aminotransferase
MRSWADISISKTAKTAFNPVRSFVENDVAQVNKEIAMNGAPAGRPASLINVSIGDPTIYADFMTNPKSVEILLEQVGKNDGYTAFAGLPEARHYLAELYSKTTKHKVNESDVFITFGGSMALWLAINSITDPGDNILFPNPGFPLAKSIALKRQVGVKDYNLIPDKNWEMDIAHTESLIDEKTKLIVVNNPSNPLGSVWSKQHILDILKLAEKHGLTIVADEIYENIIFPGEEKNSFSDLTVNVPVIKCSGLAKEFYAPGWRIGWVALVGAEGVFDEVRKGLDNLVSMIFHPNTVVMGGLKKIMETNHDFNAERALKLKERYLFINLYIYPL